MVCKDCQDKLPSSFFEFNKSKKVYRTTCKKCKNLQTMQTRYATTKSHVKRKLSRLKETSKRLDFLFNLEYDDLYKQLERQSFKCFYTDEPLVFYEYKKAPSRRVVPSVDRIDPTKGYTKGNIVWCLYRINCIKQDMTLEEMKKWTPDWYNRIMNFKENR